MNPATLVLAVWLGALTSASVSADDPPKTPTSAPVDLDRVDFGADPTGGEDSSPAFTKLLAAAGQREVRQMNISRCLFYCSDRGGAAFFKGENGPARDFEPADIDVLHGGDVIIKGSIFTEPSNPNPVGVRLSEDADYVLMAANQFNFDGMAIVNLSRLPNFSTDNIFGGSPDLSKGIRPYRDKLGTLETRDFEPRQA